MRLPLIPMQGVWHVGTLDPEMRGTQHSVSYEGAGLSVSNCPAAWRSMASLDGPTLRLVRPGALWLDLAAMPPEAREAAVAHAVDAGLAEEVPVWRAWFWEAGPDEWLSRPFRSEAAAVEWTVRTSDSEAWPRPATVEDHLAALPAKALPPPWRAEPAQERPWANRTPRPTQKGRPRCEPDRLPPHAPRLPERASPPACCCSK